MDVDRSRSVAYAKQTQAERGTRLLAVLVDALVTVLAYAPGGAIILASSDSGNPPVFGLLLLFAGGLALLVYQCILLSTRGQTIGKTVMKVRIVRFDDNTNPGFASAVMLRTFVPGIIGVIPCLGGIFTLADILFIFGEENRCIHDYIAGTKVVAA
jgi:uncharacterized RDD family membrane protein YckC